MPQPSLHVRSWGKERTSPSYAARFAFEPILLQKFFWDPSSRENGAAGEHRHSKAGFPAENQLYDCEHMVFNPWNCLPEHVVGSVNRMRLAVFLASLQARRKLNVVAS